MRILVTGATGRVGRPLVSRLRDEGHQVRVLQRGKTGPADGSSGDLEVVTGSIADAAAVRRAVADVDAVCHLAALMPPFGDEALFQANVVGTFNVIEAIRDAGATARLVFASTDATYGTGLSKRSYPQPITEGTSPEPTNFYGTTKVVGEDLVGQAGRIYAFPYVILRFAWVFAGVEVLDLFTMSMWEDFMTPEQKRRLSDSDLVPIILEADGSPFSDHVADARDVAAACALAIEAPISGEVFNVCGPAPFRYIELSPLVAGRLGRRTVELPLTDFHAYEFDGSKARRMLGFEPRHSIRDMLDEALALVEHT